MKGAEADVDEAEGGGGLAGFGDFAAGAPAGEEGEFLADALQVQGGESGEGIAFVPAFFLPLEIQGEAERLEAWVSTKEWGVCGGMKKSEPRPMTWPSPAIFCDPRRPGT